MRSATTPTYLGVPRLPIYKVDTEKQIVFSLVIGNFLMGTKTHEEFASVVGKI
jgi:hypothetical protein